MFDFVRKHTKIMQFLLFLLIVPSFVLFGLEGYTRMREKGEPVARVAGRDIMQSEWDALHKQEVDRMRAQMPGIDPKLLDSPQARYTALEALVRERVLSEAADKARLAPSDGRLARELEQNPTIAALRRPDGTLDMERYKQLVGAQGMSPEMFEARVRADLAARQVVNGVVGSGLVAPVVADVTLGAFFERREIQVARFAPADFASKVSPTDAELDAYYKEHANQYQAPEQASIEYVVLDLDAVKKGLVLNEADLKTYFEQNASRLSDKEERRASHILIAVPKTAKEEERKAGRARAEELLAQVKKAPNTFADVAKKNSQDPGSAVRGGDLDFFARGAMVKPFEDAVFAMQKGEISKVVESDFGYHVIMLTDIKGAKQRSFEEMRPELEAELKKQQAQRKFAEVAETFTNGVYEQSDGLKPVADKLKLEVKTANNLGRKPAEGTTGVLANPKLLAAIFSADSLQKKRNTEAVETAPNQLVSARVTNYVAARTLPLEDVKAKVREAVVAAKSAEMARKEGAAKLEAWKAAPASASLPEAIVVSRDQPQKQPSQVVTAALRADASKLPAFVGVDLGEQGYAVAKVLKTMPRAAPEATALKQDREQYSQWWTAAENLAYFNLLKERFKTQIKVSKPAQGLESAETASQ